MNILTVNNLYKKLIPGTLNSWDFVAQHPQCIDCLFKDHPLPIAMGCSVGILQAESLLNAHIFNMLVRC